MTDDERAERDERIWELHLQGWSVRAIAEELNISKSRVQQVLDARRAAEDTDDLDPDDLEDLDLLDDPDALALFDDAEEHWPTEPFRFVGYERQCFERGKGNGRYWADCERWVDGDGHSIGIVDEYGHGEAAEMALYRYRCHVAHELGEYERADALAADWQRQRDEYEARHRPQDRPQIVRSASSVTRRNRRQSSL